MNTHYFLIILLHLLLSMLLLYLLYLYGCYYADPCSVTHVGSLKLAMMEVFTCWKCCKSGLPAPAFPPILRTGC